MKLKDFLDRLWSMGMRKIYLAHYEDAGAARKLKGQLLQHGFTATVAADARQFGKEFVSFQITEADLVLVVNPIFEHEQLLNVQGYGVIELNG